MQPSLAAFPSYAEYRAAERRLKQSILLRDVIPDHTYPRREEDLNTIRTFHTKYGMPPSTFFKGLLWLVGGGGV